MAAPQGKSRAQLRAEDRIAAIRSSSTRRKASKRQPDQVADIYQEMLVEATASSESERPSPRPLKKRRLDAEPHVTARRSAQGSSSKPDWTTGTAAASVHHPGTEAIDQQWPLQTVEDSGSSEGEDLDWEEVGFDQNEPIVTTTNVKSDDDAIADISVEVGPKKIPKKTLAKRKPATTVEKLLRLAVHEAHVLFLIFHLHVRNSWCSLDIVHSRLKRFLPPKIIGLLHPPENIIQFSRSENFINGLKFAMDLWRVKFRVTESGMCRPQWADSADDIRQKISLISTEIRSIDKAEFVQHVTTLSGSQDMGNQLFCALLRSVGIEARLVCSLQPLPFGTAGAKSGTPMRGKATIYADVRSDGATSAEEGSIAGSASDTSTASKGPRRRRRIGQPNMAIAGTSRPPPQTTPVKKKRQTAKHILDYPIFWVEAFDAAYQRWLAVDATVTGTVNKPTKLEPPASNEQNLMSYVVAFDDLGYARDVTKRYTKAYNAKTRKLRVESTANGERWWRLALKPFRSSRHEDRDQVEDAELAKKEAQEGLPNNVQDFKDHPYYALERHLKRHEVIFPKRPVGKVNAGKSSSSNIENVYRRSDVQLVRSADKWYRVGREIKPSQQPLKHVPGRRGLKDRGVLEDEPIATALYSYAQTLLYIPPAVVGGRIPKNAFGNLDVYVPSMVPPGAVHIKHALAARAAKCLGIDFADAVTGFKFKGRIGEAVKSGVVVAIEYEEAMQTVILGFQDAAQEEEDAKRSLECLRLWRRFLTGLRIGERLGMYEPATDTGDKAAKVTKVRKELDEAENQHDELTEAGGFFPDASEATVPTASRSSPSARPRSLLSRAQDDEAEIEAEEAHDIQESAPRLRRHRKVNVEVSDEEIDDDEVEAGPMEIQEKAPRLRRKRNVPLVKSEDEDHSEEEFVPEDIRPPPIRQKRHPPARPLDEQAHKIGKAESQPPLRRSTRQTRANTKLFAKVSDSEESVESQIEVIKDVDVAEHGGGFLPDSSLSHITTVGVESLTDAEGVSEVLSNPHDGGGFILEEDAIDYETTDVASALDEQGDEDLLGGGFFPEVSDMERLAPAQSSQDRLDDVYRYDPTLIEQDVEHKSPSNDPHGVSRPSAGPVDTLDESMRMDGEAAEKNHTTDGREGIIVLSAEKREDELSEDSRSSLLSHDPDDEDAEPEWLNSD